MIGALWGRDIAVDLGTATTRISTPSRGWLVEGPSVTGVTHALEHGVIVNPVAAAAVLRALLGRARHFGPWRPRVLACAPTDITAEECATVVESLRQAGASAITVTPEPLAAAVGAGLDVSSRHAQLVVDVGHGVTDCAVIHSGQVVAAQAVRRACSDLYTAVDRHWLCLLPGEAERLVQSVGVATEPGAAGIEVVGRCHGDDRLQRVAIPARDVVSVLEPVLGQMLDALNGLLRDLPGSVGAEVIENGILLTGGGALLPGMVERIAEITGIEVRRAPDPLHAVISGARAILPTVVDYNLWQH